MMDPPALPGSAEPDPSNRPQSWRVSGGTEVDVDDLYALSTTCRLLAAAADRIRAQVAAAGLRAEAALALLAVAAGSRLGIAGPASSSLPAGPLPSLVPGPLPGLPVGPLPGLPVGPLPGLPVGPLPGLPVGPLPGLIAGPATLPATVVLTVPLALAGIAAGLAALGLRVVLAADRYVGAETGVAAAVRDAGQTIGYAERLAGRKVTPGESGSAPDLPPPGADPDSLPELLAGPFAAAYPPRTAAVGPPVDLGPVPPPNGVAGLLALVSGNAAGRPPPPGRVDVAAVRTIDAQGTARTAYVVALPGTSDWSLPGQPGRDVRNLQANLQLVAGNLTAEVAALPQALATAGVPAGASIVLVGHSQGGMTARAAAADPALRRRYRVSGVVTAGSPTGAMAAPPAGVPVLALENAADIVPRLDGRANLDAASRVTVAFSDTAPDSRSAHDLDRYAAAAGRVDRDQDPRLAAFAVALREAGAVATPGREAAARLTRVELLLTRP